MQELLNLILKNITLHPEEVKVEVTTEGDVEVYTITVAADDMGRVIGKAGKVIRAIRSLAHVVAIRQNKRFRINLAEVGGEVTSRDNEIEPEEEIEVEAEAPKEDLVAEAMATPEEE